MSSILPFVIAVAKHQHERGLKFSAYAPRRSGVGEAEDYVKVFGAPAEPKPGWTHSLSDGCQFRATRQCRGSPSPVLQEGIRVGNFDLSALALRCRCPTALVGCTHEHYKASQGSGMEGGEHADLRAAPKAGRGRGIDVGSMNAFEDACIGHSPEQATVYAKACAAAASSVSRVVHDTDTSLSELARNSNLACQERRSAGDSGSDAQP